MGSSSISPLGRAPPELPYSLRQHKLSIAIAWTVLIINSCILPLALFYALWYGTSLSPNLVLGVNTAVFGFVTLVAWAVRLWHLLTKSPFHRPLGSRRGLLDFFQISFTIGYIIVTVELALGTKSEPPLLRLCAMAPASLMFLVGGELAALAAWAGLGFGTPFRISSLPRGVAMRPGIYTIIEDIIAVDTGSGRLYREALDARYETSPLFRRMLHQLNLFWALSALAVAAAVTAVVFTPSVPETVAYGIGWSVPFLWAGLWAMITIRWVQRSLWKEKKAWRKEGSRRRPSIRDPEVREVGP